MDFTGGRSASVGLHRRDRATTQDDRAPGWCIEDHIHALVMAPPKYAPSQIAQYLKGDSSKWIHEEFPKMRGFEWQDGYGAFTISKSQVPHVIEYIKNHREHHRKRTFQEEYLELLQKHSVHYDERYLWG